MYYLQSRYYDPAICRFINADGLASTGQGIIGHNMYAYCLNNPVFYVDVPGSEAERIDLTDEDKDGDGLPDEPSGAASGTTSEIKGVTNHSNPNIPTKAWTVLDYLKTHFWHPIQNYKGGKEYQNDGRDGSQILPDSGNQYYEFDINPKIPYVDRGDERIVTDKMGTTWYTGDHYRTFWGMEQP